MEENINKILSQLALAFEAKSVADREREKAHTAKMAQIVDGLAALAILCSANDNEVSDPVIASATPQPELEKQSRCGKSSRIEDDQLFQALTADWITAGNLRKLLLSRGTTIAEGTVYNRMRKLSSKRSEEIETASKPERWRLRPSHKVVKRSTKQTKIEKIAKPLGNQLFAAPTRCASALSECYRPELHHGDCLEVMKTIPDNSVHLILADLPYGTTRLSIDMPLALDELWSEYRRILCKPHGNIVLFGSQPFTTALINAAPDMFRYALVWDKNTSTGFQHASAKPLKKHEDILVFSFGVNISEKRTKRRATYNDQQAVPVKRIAKARTKVNYLPNAFRGHLEGHEYVGLKNCQTSILNFPKKKAKSGEIAHPFEKPHTLLEHLIRTYSNEGETVLDNTMGGGGTCIAAMHSGRHSIGIEKDKHWFDYAKKRIEHEHTAITPIAEAKPILPLYKTATETIYQGDCLEVMKELPSGSVDLVVTSPPYNLALCKQKRMKDGQNGSLWPFAKLADGYRSYDDAMPHDEYVAWMRAVLAESWRLLSDDGAIFMNHKPRLQKGKLWTPLDLNPNLPLRQIVIWDRMCGFNFNRSSFTPTHEWIVILAKPNFRFAKGKKPGDVWRFSPERSNDHPAPYPVQLPLNAIQHTDAKVVLDPFMGSGTTGVAAKQCERKFIGIELDEQYATDAITRMNDDARKMAA